MCNDNVNHKISIVVPIYNEEEVIHSLCDRTVRSVMAISPDYEIIFVDDGSNDKSLDLLIELHEANPRLKVVSLSRNFGHQSAILAGLTIARGDYIGIMDGDLQDPPELFGTFVAKIEVGYDVVYAVRRTRKESFSKRTLYWFYYRIFYSLSETKIPLDSGDFCMMKRKVLDEILEIPEQSLYLRGIRSWVGFKQCSFHYDREPRTVGEAKYDLKQLFQLAYNGIYSFSSVPIRIMRWVGLITIVLCVIYGAKILTNYFFFRSAPQGFATIALGLFFLGGVQLFSLGILGEYIHRTYNESRRRPLFIIDRNYTDD